jgi:hypothetical protein
MGAYWGFFYVFFIRRLKMKGLDFAWRFAWRFGWRFGWVVGWPFGWVVGWPFGWPFGWILVKQILTHPILFRLQKLRVSAFFP